MTDLAKLVVKLEAQTAQYMQQLDAANRKLDKFTKSSDISAKNIAKGVAVAAVAAAAAFGAMANAAIQQGDALDEMAQKTGVSVESLSRLEYAAKFSGVSLEDLATANGKLSKNMAAAAQGSKTAVAGFKQIGVSVKEADGSLRGTEEVLLDVAERFSKMEDGAAKSALAMQIFGKAGANLIPFLNAGKKGIADLTAEADRLGITMSSKTAAQAAAFSDNMDRLKGAVKGLVNQFVERMLPTLIAISDRFVRSATDGGKLSAAVGVLAATFKTLVSAGIIVKAVFETLGRVIYGVGAALTRVAQGEFKMAAQELTDAFEESKDSVSTDIEDIAKIWSDKVPEFQEVAKDMDSAMKESIVFNPVSAKSESQKAAEAALDSLKDMAKDLKDQVATFGMAEEAAIRYRVAQGDIAATLGKAGEAGREYTEQIIQQTDKLEALKKAQEASKKAQEAMNQAVEDGKAVTESVLTPAEKYALALERLDKLRTSGTISATTYSKAADKAKKEMEEATKVVNKFLEEASENTQDILGDGIYTAMTEGFSKGAKSALKSFGQMIEQMIAQALAAQLAAKLFGGGGVGSGGGWVGAGMNWLAGAFGGKRDSGGRGARGQAVLIGTGAQPEMFVPDVAGDFYPANQWMGKGGGVTQNFYVNGNVDQRTARQIEIDSTRRQRQAQRLT